MQEAGKGVEVGEVEGTSQFGMDFAVVAGDGDFGGEVPVGVCGGGEGVGAAVVGEAGFEAGGGGWSRRCGGMRAEPTDVASRVWTYQVAWKLPPLSSW
ncbi:hypothetical protein GTX14_25430 [Streptomyces sp. SID4944]|nr:hypothetical protein [Streptomyces sp. SID4944]